jgi:hypothetical protein
MLKVGTYTLIESSAITGSFHYSRSHSVCASIFCNKKENYAIRNYVNPLSNEQRLRPSTLNYLC